MLGSPCSPCCSSQCTCEMCPSACPPTRLLCSCRFDLGETSVEFPLRLTSSAVIGFNYAGCGVYQARWGDGVECAVCDQVFPQVTATVNGEGITAGITGFLFVRFASHVNGMQNRIEVSGVYSAIGGLFTWQLAPPPANYGYSDAAGPSIGYYHWLSNYEYVSQSSPLCYLDAPVIGPIPIVWLPPYGTITWSPGTLSITVLSVE